MQQRGVSPSVLNRSATQHLCLEKMYSIQVMKDLKEKIRTKVMTMNKSCCVFQEYVKGVL